MKVFLFFSIIIISAIRIYGIDSRPNVVLLLADDLGSRDLSCYDGPVKTPNLDFLARKGVRFTSFHAGAAVCSPSRATFLTGRQHLRTGVYGVLQDSTHNAHLLESEVTLAEVLSQNGYRTAHFGKWHLGMSLGKRVKPDVYEHGFDYWFGLSNGANPSHKNPTNFMRNGERVGPLKGYSCQLIINDAIEWLKKGESGKPFLMNLWFNEPHSVLAAPDHIVGQYGKAGDSAALYSATVDNMDRAIGRLVTELESRDLLDNTIIIFSSDHGSYREDRNGGLRGNKGSNFQGGLLSPGIFFWPKGFPGGRVEDEACGAVDLLPTLCGLVGVDKPKGVHLDGEDLTPLLRGKSTIQRQQPLFWYNPEGWPTAALRMGDYTLVGFRDYEFPRDHVAMKAKLDRIAKLVGVPDSTAGGNFRSRVFNSTFSNPEANRLRSEYVRLHTFRESWIPLIKKGGFKRFELYDVRKDPAQSKNLFSSMPKLGESMKKKLLSLCDSALGDAPDWTESPRQRPRKDYGLSKKDPMKDLLEQISSRPLPEGYHGSIHQKFVDEIQSKLSEKQRYEIYKLWKKKRELEPNLKNPGASFVRIMMHVADGISSQAGKSKPAKVKKPKPEILKSPRKKGALPKVGNPTLLSPHSHPIELVGGTLFVTNTASDTLDVIDAQKNKVTLRIPVGIDPVCAKARPDGKEVWVSNHISDSVSVIDSDPSSPTYLSVIDTVQDIDPVFMSTRFDEPVGIAFAGNSKAYVALSSTNRVAVIDVKSRKVTGHLIITSQEPRALEVSREKLYVLPFESNNQTQLSGGKKVDLDGKLFTFVAADLAGAFDSAGFTVDVVKHKGIPDRDLYVFDVRTDKLEKSVRSLGTLLFGLDVDSAGNVFVAHTDARNHANGRAGTKGHGLKELENRPYLNRVAKVSPQGKVDFIHLNPLPPEQPKRSEGLATPFAIEVSRDLICLTLAGSDRLVTLDPNSGKILGRVKVGGVPRGIKLELDRQGKPKTAWVFNAVENSLSKVDLRSPSLPKVTGELALHDPTPPIYKKGRLAFNTARASSFNTASCASCHPDGNTDHQLWVLDTPHLAGADQIEPRLSQNLRGLRGTAPYHWDGVPGDPYGGLNASTKEYLEPNSDPDKPESAVRHVIDSSMSSTMISHGSERQNDEGKKGYLGGAERDAMTTFLLNLSHMPTRGRAIDDDLSKEARQGFELFHVTGARDHKNLNNTVCGSCHTFPYLATDGNEYSVPSFRGALDRFVTQAQGRNNLISLNGIKEIAEKGYPEEEVWKRMLGMGEHGRLWPVIDMFKEQSSGYSGAFGKQVTVNRETVPGEVETKIVEYLEWAAVEGTVVLQANGVLLSESGKTSHLHLTYDGISQKYRSPSDPLLIYSTEQLLELAKQGELTVTFTGRHGEDVISVPPAIWTKGLLHKQRGVQLFPRVNHTRKVMEISGRHILPGATLFVNGRRVGGQIRKLGKELVEVSLEKIPPQGMNMLQVHNPKSYLSNELIFYSETREQAIRRYRKEPAVLLTTILNSAIVNHNPEEARILLEAGPDINMPHTQGSLTRPPIIIASQYRQGWMIDELLKLGADVNIQDMYGNTALHEAARMGHLEICRKLIDAGAKTNVINDQKRRPVDQASHFISLNKFERYRINHANLELDHKRYLQDRVKVLALLKSQ